MVFSCFCKTASRYYRLYIKMFSFVFLVFSCFCKTRSVQIQVRDRRLASSLSTFRSVSFIDKTFAANRKAPLLASRSGAFRLKKRHFSHRKAPLLFWRYYIRLKIKRLGKRSLGLSVYFTKGTSFAASLTPVTARSCSPGGCSGCGCGGCRRCRRRHGGRTDSLRTA